MKNTKEYERGYEQGYKDCFSSVQNHRKVAKTLNKTATEQLTGGMYKTVGELQKTTKNILKEVEGIVLSFKKEGIYYRGEKEVLRRLKFFLKKYRGI